MNTLESNKLIAEFMTEEPEVLAHDLMKAGTLESMQYHDDWNWLMEVVEKVNVMDDYRFTVVIKSMDVVIFDNIHKRKVFSSDCKWNCDELISAIHEAMVEFIIWYNKQKRL